MFAVDFAAGDHQRPTEEPRNRHPAGDWPEFTTNSVSAADEISFDGIDRRRHRLRGGLAGGCSIQRTLESHNECLVKLKETFPAFIKLREKVAKNSGEWSGKIKLAATISWKKAYQSSQNLVGANDNDEPDTIRLAS